MNVAAVPASNSIVEKRQNSCLSFASDDAQKAVGIFTIKNGEKIIGK